MSISAPGRELSMWMLHPMGSKLFRAAVFLVTFSMISIIYMRPKDIIQKGGYMFFVFVVLSLDALWNVTSLLESAHRLGGTMYLCFRMASQLYLYFSIFSMTSTNIVGKHINPVEIYVRHRGVLGDFFIDFNAASRLLYTRYSLTR